MAPNGLLLVAVFAEVWASLFADDPLESPPELTAESAAAVESDGATALEIDDWACESGIAAVDKIATMMRERA
jgi:hypothetical protein